MSDTMKSNPFLNAVDKYKLKEKAVEKDFLTGILALGKILKEERAIWKPQNIWTEYLEEIGKSMAGANQFIRLYEYSELDMNTLKKANLTNWAKINSFLAIPEEVKIKIAKKLKGKSVLDSEAYQKAIEEINVSVLVENIEEEYDFESEGNFMNNSGDILQKIIKEQIKKGVDLNDIKTSIKQKIANEIIKGINKQSPKNHQLSKSSQKVLEKIIDLKLATITLFREAKNLNNLEKSLWGDMLQLDCIELEQVIDKEFLYNKPKIKNKKTK
ncbi:MAG: hypothetical protein KAT66_00405 [Candidatus Lokiarchaeota archaeon]|nr:hypothetical protein [Candidatus Lokiarchaeota archaeon]